MILKEFTTLFVIDVCYIIVQSNIEHLKSAEKDRALRKIFNKL